MSLTVAFDRDLDCDATSASSPPGFSCGGPSPMAATAAIGLGDDDDEEVSPKDDDGGVDILSHSTNLGFDSHTSYF